MKLASIAALVALAAVCAGCGGTKGPSQAAFRGTLLSPAPAAPAFTLRDQTGKPVSLAGERGHYVVVTFLYTRCLDVCPLIAGTLNRVLATPVGRSVGLRVFAVGVDPKGDTPSAVRGFVREHQLAPAFRYLTGTRDELQPVWTAFHIAVELGPSGPVTHSSFELLIDPQGRERLIYDSTVTVAAVVHDLTELQGAA